MHEGILRIRGGDLLVPRYGIRSPVTQKTFHTKSDTFTVARVVGRDSNERADSPGTDRILLILGDQTNVPEIKDTVGLGDPLFRCMFGPPIARVTLYSAAQEAS